MQHAKHLHITLNEQRVDMQERLPPPKPEAHIGWNTLEELREIAMAEGCSAEQIAEAVKAAEHDPCKVARILHGQLVDSYLQSQRIATR